jgi:hypothetical protein
MSKLQESMRHSINVVRGNTGSRTFTWEELRKPINTILDYCRSKIPESDSLFMRVNEQLANIVQVYDMNDVIFLFDLLEEYNLGSSRNIIMSKVIEHLFEVVKLSRECIMNHSDSGDTESNIEVATNITRYFVDILNATRFRTDNTEYITYIAVISGIVLIYQLFVSYYNITCFSPFEDPKNLKISEIPYVRGYHINIFSEVSSAIAWVAILYSIYGAENNNYITDNEIMKKIDSTIDSVTIDIRENKRIQLADINL